MNRRSEIIGKSKQRYTSEFKQEALERLENGTYTVRQLAAELGISPVTLINWKKVQGQKSSLKGEELNELARLRAELAKVTEERDRLRLGIAYLVGAVK